RVQLPRRRAARCARPPPPSLVSVGAHMGRTPMKTADAATKKRVKYDGYKSFQYLEAGTDYRDFKLAKELNRVPSRRVEVSDAQEERVWRLLDENVAISLHDHCFIVPEDFADL